MHREERLRLLHECKYPIRVDEGTAYPCSQTDLDGYVRFYRSNEHMVYVSPNRATNNLVQWLDIHKNPDSESAAALERLKQGTRIQKWGPDLLIKAFKDLDQAFFMGTLTGNVLVHWKNTREISDRWGLGSSRGVTWGSTSKMGHGRAGISINSKPHFTRARDPHREMWRTMLHEMCVSQLFVLLTIFLCHSHILQGRLLLTGKPACIFVRSMRQRR